MKSPPSGSSVEQNNRFAFIGLGALIAYTLVRGLFTAAAKPFWFDEFCTLAVAGQPKLSALWIAFLRCEDSNPLLYSVIEHFCAKLVPNAEISYRLTSILGFGCVLWCLFVFIRKRSESWIALLCTAVPVLTLLYRPYAFEARPYSLVVACIALALVCYQHAPETRWMVLMGLSLTTAEALHYFALILFFPFAAAELVWTAKKKQFRWGVWLALASGLLPLAPAWPLLAGMRQFYGRDFWGKPSLSAVLTMYSFFFRTNGYLGLLLAALLSLAALRMAFLTARRTGPGSARPADSFHEPVLAIGFLVLPFVAFAFAEVTHGTFVHRYVLSLVLGMSIATAYCVQLLGRWSAIPLALVVCGALVVQEGKFWRAEAANFGQPISSANSVELLAGSAGYPELPVVVSSGVEYIQLAHYASPEWAGRFVDVVDPSGAVAYTGSDSVDRQMTALQCCLPLQVYAFQSFAVDHPRFLLYSSGAAFDWWPGRLHNDGYSLELVATDGDRKVFLVSRSNL